MLNNLSLRRKISLGFGICLLLLMVASCISFWGLKSADSGFVQYRSLARLSNISGRLQANLLIIRMDVKNYLLSTENRFIDSYNERTKLIHSLFEQAKKQIKQSDRLASITQIQSDLQRYEMHFEQVVQLTAERNILVNQVLDKNGLSMRKAVTSILLSAYQDKDSEASFYASQVQEKLMLGRLYSNKYLKTNAASDFEFAEDYLNNELVQAAELLDEQLQNPKRRALYAEFKQASEQYTETLQGLHQLTEDRNRIINNKLDINGPKMADELEQLKLSFLGQQDELGPQQQSRNNWSVSLVVFSTLAALLAGIIISISMTRAISTNLDQAVNYAKELEQGHFDTDIKITAKDEISLLIQSLKNMAMSIATVIKDIESASYSITRSADDVTRATEQTHNGAKSQLSGIDRVVAAIQNLTNNVTTVSDSANQAAESASQANQLTENGYQVIQDAVHKIQHLAKDMASSVEEINKLKEQSQNIGSILDVIRNIADQTNLLALNAAIEAARAGEQGRGFAVVADEVRTLAQRTQESIAQIESLINELQDGTENAVVSINQGQELVAETVKSAASAGEAIELIRPAIRDINQINGQIAIATKEQNQLTSEIDNNVTKVSQISNDSAQLSEDTKQLSAELTQVAKDLKAAVEKFS